MKLQHHAKTAYTQEPVSMPIVGVGECKNSRRCRNIVADLANGYCVQCWDKGLDNRRKPENIKEPTIKKSRRAHFSMGENKWLM